MKVANIKLGVNVSVDPSSSINNVSIGDNSKIAKRCSIFGSPASVMEIGNDTYIGMNTIINGFEAKVTIGSNVSIAQNVNIMADSGPNASLSFQKIFPVIKGEVSIGDNSWLGAGAIIMPGVTIGRYCAIAANSFVKESFKDYSIIGGTPAKLIRMLTKEEIEKIQADK
jgi:acetyltransferase-like isoleucine patch superfamily enzyme